MMIHHITNLLKAALVRRWHQNPDMANCGETLGQHQWDVVTIALELTRGELSREGILCAHFHDCGELIAGDIGAMTKGAPGNENLMAMHGELESNALAAMVTLPEISDRETAIIKVADIMAAQFRAARHAPWLLSEPDWIDQRRRARELAIIHGAYIARLLMVLRVECQRRRIEIDV